MLSHFKEYIDLKSIMGSSGLVSLFLSILTIYYNLIYKNKRNLKINYSYKNDRGSRDDIYLYITNIGQTTINIEEINIKSEKKGQKVSYKSFIDGKEYRKFSEVKSGSVLVITLEGVKHIPQKHQGHNCFIECMCEDFLNKGKISYKFKYIEFNVDTMITLTTGEYFSKRLFIKRKTSEVNYKGSTLGPVSA